MNERDIFAAALERESPQQIASFLEEACGDDRALRERIEALLRSHDEAGSFLEHSPLELDDTILQNENATDPEEIDATVVNAGTNMSLEFLQPLDAPNRMGALGPYEIIEVIGRGGMGVVLRALDPKLNRIVAVKVLAPELAANAMARQRFQREAQAAAAVSHPHVVTIHAVDDADPVPYIVMECVEGQSLQDKLNRNGALGIREILRIGSQIAQGLAAAHAQGLIHRDVKPGNVLLENGVERVKLTDFGLARAVDDVGMTQTGVVAGTPQYMSPEQAEGKPVDHRSDLFSLGSVLYAMCTGRPPFRADSTIAVLRRVCDDTPRPIREINPEIPEWLVEVIDRLLHKDPAKRIQTAKEVADLLSGHLAHLQHPATPPPAFPVLEDVSVADLVSRRRGSGRKRSDSSASSAGRGRMFRIAAFIILLALVAVSVTEATGVTQIAATIIRIAQGEGTLIIEVNDPNISVSVDGEEVVITGAGPKEIRLKPGEYTVTATKDGKPINREIISIERNGRQVLRMGRELTPLRTPSSTNDASDFPLISQLAIHESPVKEVMFSADGTEIISAERNGAIHVTDVETEGIVRTIQAPAPLAGIAYSPATHRIAALAGDNAIYVWSAATGKLLGKLIGHERNKGDLAFSPDGSRIVSRNYDQTIRWWNAETFEEIGRVPADSLSGYITWLADGGGVVVGKGDFISQYPSEPGEPSDRFRLGTNRPNSCLAVSANGRFLAAGAYGLTEVVLHDSETQNIIRIGTESTVLATAFLSQGRFLVTAEWNGTLRVFDTQSNREIASTSVDAGSCNRIAVSPDGRTVIAAGGWVWDGEQERDTETGDYAVRLWRLPESVRPQSETTGDRITLPLRATFQKPARPIDGIAYLPNGETIVTVSSEGLALWSTADGSRTALLGEGMNLDKLAVAPDGRIAAASGKEDGAIYLFDLERGEQVGRIEAHKNGLPLNSLDFSSDGTRLLSRSRDKTLQMWDVAKQEPVFDKLPMNSSIGESRFIGSSQEFVFTIGNWFDRHFEVGKSIAGKQILRELGYCLAVSPNGKLAAIGEWNGAIDIVDLDQLAVIQEFASDARVTSLAFLPDSRGLVSGSFDRTLRLWDVKAGRELARITLEKHGVNHVAVSPDGRTVATAGGMYVKPDGSYAGDGDYAVRLWQLPDRLTQPEEQTQEDGIVLARKLTGNTDVIRAVGYTADGQIVSLDADKTMRFFDAETGKPMDAIEGVECYSSATVNAAGTLAAGTDNQLGPGGALVDVWDLQTKKLLRRIDAGPEMFKYSRDVLLRPHERQVLIFGWPPRAVLFDIDTGEEIRRFEPVEKEAKMFSAGDFSPDGKTLALATQNANWVWVFDVETGELRTHWEAQGRRVVNELQFSPDGTHLLVGSSGGEANLYKVGETEPSLTLETSRTGENGAHVQAAEFLRGGRYLLLGTSGRDRALSLWDLQTAMRIAETTVETDVLEQLAISPDGRHAVSGSGESYSNEKKNDVPNGDFDLRLWRLPESVWPDSSLPQESAAFILTPPTTGRPSGSTPASRSTAPAATAAPGFSPPG